LYVIRLYQRVHIHIRNKHEATVLKYSGTKSKYFITVYFPITGSSETHGTLAYNKHKRWCQNYSYVSIKTLNFTCILFAYARCRSLLDLKILSDFSKKREYVPRTELKDSCPNPIYKRLYLNDFTILFYFFLLAKE